MKSLHFLFLSLLLFQLANAQRTDSASHNIPESWKKKELAPRIAFGIQKAFYLEAGAALQDYHYSAGGFVANTIYAAAEWTPGSSTVKDVWGVKLGAETAFNGGTGGIEIKYLTNTEEKDIVITPKMGFGIGLATLFYGYNFSTNKYPFERVRKHQFSVAVNTNMLFHYMKKKNKSK